MVGAGPYIKQSYFTVKGWDPTLIIMPFCEKELSDRITELPESS
jgi:hypothetical protein